MKALGVVVLAGALAIIVGMRMARSQAQHQAMTPGELKWGEAPPTFNKAAKMAVLYGDPKTDGLFIVRLKMPAGYKIMPHWHPTDENVTVVSGSFAMGFGDTLDPHAKALGAGGFMSMPAKMHHYAAARNETVVQVSAMGPFAMIYVNPADDPSKQQATAK